MKKNRVAFVVSLWRTMTTKRPTGLMRAYQPIGQPVFLRRGYPNASTCSKWSKGFLLKQHNCYGDSVKVCLQLDNNDVRKRGLYGSFCSEFRT